MRGRLRTGVQARNDGDLWKEDKATGDDSGSVVKECADEIPAYGGKHLRCPFSSFVFMLLLYIVACIMCFRVFVF